MTSSTTNSLNKLRKEGYLCAIVEHFNPHGGVRQDLFGVIDILAIKENEILGVQTTTVKSFDDHFKKITQHKNLIPLKRSGIKLVLQAWEKRLEKGRMLWKCKEVIF